MAILQCTAKHKRVVRKRTVKCDATNREAGSPATLPRAAQATGTVAKTSPTDVNRLSANTLPAAPLLSLEDFGFGFGFGTPSSGVTAAAAGAGLTDTGGG